MPKGKAGRERQDNVVLHLYNEFAERWFSVNERWTGGVIGMLAEWQL